MSSALLLDRAVLEISGEDATSFLQGLVTCDVEGLQTGQAVFGALLSPQGKILFDFLITATAQSADAVGPGFLLDGPAALAADLARRLSMYRLRAKVSIDNLSAAGVAPAPLAVLAQWDGGFAPHPGAVTFADPRHPQLGQRTILRADEAEGPHEDASAYDAWRIRLGVPQGGVDFAYGDAFPHDANMDQLHGVAFDKGCFIGQEVVSRMKHRGTARKRTVRLRVDATPPWGEAVVAGERSIGTMGSSAVPFGLAMIRTDRAEEALAAGETLSVGPIAVRLDPA